MHSSIWTCISSCMHGQCYANVTDVLAKRFRMVQIEKRKMMEKEMEGVNLSDRRLLPARVALGPDEAKPAIRASRTVFHVSQAMTAKGGDTSQPPIHRLRAHPPSPPPPPSRSFSTLVHTHT